MKTLLLLMLTVPAFADEPVAPSAIAPVDAPPPSKPTPAPSPPTPDPAPAIAVVTNAPREHFVPWPAGRLSIELELYSQARVTRREGDDLSELRLDRGELGGRVQLGRQAAAELRFESVRSAVEGGSLGVDGDSTVFRLKYAQVMGTHDLGPVRLEGALGFVPDPWIRALEDDYTVKPLSRAGSERLLGWPASDLTALARVTYGPARATIAVGNGEGPRYPERNTGKTTTGVVEVAAVDTDAIRLVASGVVRDGSIGVASIRERRFGGGLTIVTPWVRGGAEVVQALGIGDRGGAEGLLAGGWTEGRLVDRLFVSARGATLGFTDDGGRLSTVGGGISVEPWREAGEHARGRFRIWLAVDRVTSSGGAMPLPGADAGDATLVMLVASAIAPFTLE